MAENESVFYANQISKYIQTIFIDNSSGLVLAGEQIKQLDKKSPDFRERVRNIMTTFLETQPDLFTSWLTLQKGVVSDDWFTFNLIVQEDKSIVEFTDKVAYELLRSEDRKEKIPWYSTPFETGELYFDNLGAYNYGGTLEYTLTVSYPLKVGDETLGVIGTDACYKNYYSFLDEIQQENEQGVMLINEKGEIIYSYQERMNGTLLFESAHFEQEEAMREALVANTSFQTEDKSFLFDGKSFIYICPIIHEAATKPIYMFVDVPVERLYRSAYRISKIILLIGGIICVILTLSVYFSIRKSIKIIKSITALAKEIINGNYKVDVKRYISMDKTKYKDEIATLGNSIIKMLGQIEANMDERDQFTRELKEAKEKAEESSRLKSAFLANMSHEIRTPLNAIVGFSSILETIDDPEEKRDYVNLIQHNNNVLLQLISDILDLSKIEAGTLEFVYSDFDLNDMMRTLESTMQLKLTNPDIELTFVSYIPNCWIHSEKNRLTQLLTNLISNAIKFTERGFIHFGYRVDSEKEDFLYFFVTDTGIGISEEEQATIFERFVKLHTFAQGAGLGLPICQVIIQQLGGEIGVASEENKGSTFWFKIPYEPCKG